MEASAPALPQALIAGPLEAEVEDKTDELLGMLAVDLRRSEMVQRLMLAVGNELERIESFMYGFLRASFPQYASDEYNTLSIWEAQLGLPIKPPGLSETQRRQTLMGRLAARTADEGQDWIAAAQLVIGPGWTHMENFPGPDQLTIIIGYTEGSVQAERVETLLRDFTPAHLELIVTYGEGFIVGVSRVGEEAV